METFNIFVFSIIQFEYIALCVIHSSFVEQTKFNFDPIRSYIICTDG